MAKEKIVYDVALDEWDEGIFAISLVDSPAIESQFMFFDAQTKTLLFADMMKQEVVGAVMIPDILIPRVAGDGSVYYIRFTKEVISNLNERMKEIGYDKAFTFQHEYEASKNVNLLESWIKEFDEDKSNAYGFDLPIGTMFIKVKVTEDLLWELVKKKKLKGFSIELNASYKLNEELTTKKEEMNKKDLFAHSLDANDTLLVWDGEADISADTLLFQIDKTVKDEVEVETLSKFSGEFELEDGTKLKSENGTVAFIIEELEEVVIEETKSPPVEDMVTAINNAVASQLEGLKDMFAKQKEDLDGLAQSLEDVKLLQKQNDSGKKVLIVDDKKDTREPRNFSEANKWFKSAQNRKQ